MIAEFDLASYIGADDDVVAIYDSDYMDLIAWSQQLYEALKGGYHRYNDFCVDEILDEGLLNGFIGDVE